MLTYWVLCARHCAKCFIFNYSFNPPNNLVRFVFGSATNLHFTNEACRGQKLTWSSTSKCQSQIWIQSSWTPDLCFQILLFHTLSQQIIGQNPKFKHGQIWTKIGKGLEKNTWDLNPILLDFKDLFPFYQATTLNVKLLCLQ